MRIATIVFFLFLVVGNPAVNPVAGAAPSAAWFPQAPPLPEPAGQLVRVSNVDQLYRAAKEIEAGGTILLDDGIYRMPRYFEISTNNVTLRGESGDRDAVILDGGASRHGELVGITGCQGVTIADLTVQNVKWNGIKINSDRGAQRVTVHNCVIHNIWQRGVKAPAVPEAEQQRLSPHDCRVQYCLFYNDRPKRFSDDETDTPRTFNGNYIGGIDVKNTVDWTITDNVFIGIQGRTREGRGCVYISEDGQGCRIERNVFLDCDIAIALGNPSLGYSPLQAIGCVARNNFISNCPETGILACYTRDCQIENNTIHEPESKRGRLIWVQQSNEGLRVAKNLLIGAPILVTSKSSMAKSGNVVYKKLADAEAAQADVGQRLLKQADMVATGELVARRKTQRAHRTSALQQAGVQRPEVLEAMRKVHAGFKGQSGYVAQFGDSITYSMAFWSPIGWDEPQRYLAVDDDLPKQPKNARWRDYVKGTRDKGPKFANYSGWRVGQLLKATDAVLQREQPEVAIIMIGTNDISSGKVPDGFGEQLQQVIRKCTSANCVPIVNTIPPRRGHNKAVDEANQIIREVAQKLNVPVADFHAECIRLRPNGSWDGTIIAQDGVHPSGGKSNIYTEENMKNCGYALRNWINFLVLRQLYFQVLNSPSGRQ